MMKQSENSDQDEPEKKQKSQKRKQKDEGSAETVQSNEDIPSKKIVPSFSSHNKDLKNVKAIKSKTVLKKNAMKKVIKKAKTKIKKFEEMDNVDNSVSDETLKTNDVNLTADTASLNSKQIEEEQLPIVTSINSPTCKLQSPSNNKNEIIASKDDTTLENKDNSISESKELNYNEIDKESSLVETNVAQIPLLESDLKNFNSSSSSETKQKTENEHTEMSDINNKKGINSSDEKYGEYSEEAKAINDNCKESNSKILSNENNASQNDVKSDRLSQLILKQNTLIQNQSSLLSTNDSSQNVLIQGEKSNECKVNDTDHSKNSDQVINCNNEHPDEIKPVINSNDESVDLVKVIPNEKGMTPIKPLTLTAVLEEVDKESIPQSNKDLGLNKAPEILTSAGTCVKDSVMFDDTDLTEDSDLTDSQLCETEWTMTGDSLSESSHSKKTDWYLAKFKKAERNGTQIVNELITELSRLNKLLLHFKREIDTVWKRKKGSSATSQQNVFKKRASFQTVLGQFR